MSHKKLFHWAIKNRPAEPKVHKIAIRPAKTIYLRKTKILPTVRLKWRAHFAVDILLLHHYKSSLVHLSDFDSLVIGLSKSERREKNNEKNEGLVVHLRNLHTF